MQATWHDLPGLAGRLLEGMCATAAVCTLFCSAVFRKRQGRGAFARLAILASLAGVVLWFAPLKAQALQSQTRLPIAAQLRLCDTAVQSGTDPQQVRDCLPLVWAEDADARARARAGFAAAIDRINRSRAGNRPAVTRIRAPYVVQGACPHEGCRYGVWFSAEPRTLYSSPDGSPLGARIEPGERVAALTGTVFVNPARAVVVRDFGSLKAGDQVLVLDYLGEGQAVYWSNGRYFADGQPDCPRLDCTAILRLEGPRRPGVDVSNAAEYTWWVKVQRRDGTQGWIRNDSGFEYESELPGFPASSSDLADPFDPDHLKYPRLLLAAAGGRVTKTLDTMPGQGLGVSLDVAFIVKNDGIEVEVLTIQGQQLSGQISSAVAPDEQFDLMLRASAKRDCNDCENNFAASDTGYVLELRDRKIIAKQTPVSLFIPWDDLQGRDLLIFDLGSPRRKGHSHGTLFILRDAFNIPELIAELSANKGRPTLPPGWFAQYRDTFLSEETTITTVALARERNYPTSIDTRVLREVAKGTQLTGRWVAGAEPGVRWFKPSATGGYIWQGNLTSDPVTPPQAGGSLLFTNGYAPSVQQQGENARFVAMGGGDLLRRLAAPDTWAQVAALSAQTRAGGQRCNIPADQKASAPFLLDYAVLAIETVAQSYLQDCMEKLAQAARLPLTDLQTLHWARNKGQAGFMPYDTLATRGFRLAPTEETAFHVFGLDAARIEKWFDDQGAEYVYLRPARAPDPAAKASGQPLQVFDGTNDGTYNIVPIAMGSNGRPDPASENGHLLLDVFPWVLWGASRDDRTDFAARRKLLTQAAIPKLRTKASTALPDLASELGRARTAGKVIDLIEGAHMARSIYDVMAAAATIEDMDKAIAFLNQSEDLRLVLKADTLTEVTNSLANKTLLKATGLLGKVLIDEVYDRRAAAGQPSLVPREVMQSAFAASVNVLTGDIVGQSLETTTTLMRAYVVHNELKGINSGLVDTVRAGAVSNLSLLASNPRDPRRIRLVSSYVTDTSLMSRGLADGITWKTTVDTQRRIDLVTYLLSLRSAQLTGGTPNLSLTEIKAEAERLDQLPDSLLEGAVQAVVPDRLRRPGRRYRDFADEVARQFSITGW